VSVSQAGNPRKTYDCFCFPIANINAELKLYGLVCQGSTTDFPHETTYSDESLKLECAMDIEVGSFAILKMERCGTLCRVSPSLGSQTNMELTSVRLMGGSVIP